ncbi:MAG: hypothetical protein U5K28_05575 [Halobacteriales archaeon]|nr:hypothetical protein [Halobacteriales archaeon]
MTEGDIHNALEAVSLIESGEKETRYLAMDMPDRADLHQSGMNINEDAVSRSSSVTIERRRRRLYSLTKSVGGNMTVTEQQIASGIQYQANEIEDEQQKNDKYTTQQEVAAETTFYGDRPAEGYNPSERLLDGRTRSEKFGSLWARNAGVDSHRADGCSPEDVGKVNENKRDKRRLVETYSQNVDLDSGRVEEASDLAAEIDARAFGYHGGREALAFGIVQHVANFDVYETIDWFSTEVDARLTSGIDSLKWATTESSPR